MVRRARPYRGRVDPVTSGLIRNEILRFSTARSRPRRCGRSRRAAAPSPALERTLAELSQTGRLALRRSRGGVAQCASTTRCAGWRSTGAVDASSAARDSSSRAAGRGSPRRAANRAGFSSWTPGPRSEATDGRSWGTGRGFAVAGVAEAPAGKSRPWRREGCSRRDPDRGGAAAARIRTRAQISQEYEDGICCSRPLKVRCFHGRLMRELTIPCGSTSWRRKHGAATDSSGA